MNIMRYGGVILRRGSKIARGQKCCCGNPTCCGCPHLERGGVSGLLVTLTGALEGSGTIHLTSGEITSCWEYFGSIELTGGECLTDVGDCMPIFSLRCRRASPRVEDIELLVSDPSFCGLCHPYSIPDDENEYRKPSSASCSEPCNFTASWTYHIAGLCSSCTDSEYTVTISRICPP